MLKGQYNTKNTLLGFVYMMIVCHSSLAWLQNCLLRFFFSETLLNFGTSDCDVFVNYELCFSILVYYKYSFKIKFALCASICLSQLYMDCGFKSHVYIQLISKYKHFSFLFCFLVLDVFKSVCIMCCVCNSVYRLPKYIPYYRAYRRNNAFFRIF